VSVASSFVRRSSFVRSSFVESFVVKTSNHNQFHNACLRDCPVVTPSRSVLGARGSERESRKSDALVVVLLLLLVVVVVDRTGKGGKRRARATNRAAGGSRDTRASVDARARARACRGTGCT